MGLEQRENGNDRSMPRFTTTRWIPEFIWQLIATSPLGVLSVRHGHNDGSSRHSFADQSSQTHYRDAHSKHSFSRCVLKQSAILAAIAIQLRYQLCKLCLNHSISAVA